MTTAERKHDLSAIANDVLTRCSQKINTSVDALVEEFDDIWKPEKGDYTRKLVEYCSSRALNDMCSNIKELISDRNFSRLSFDMMLAWEKPSSTAEDEQSEHVAKEKEETKVLTNSNQQDQIPLFYSDIMPLLVDREPSVGEDAFVWLVTVVPLIADVVNGRFTFETLTATTVNRLHFPAYDKFLKEIDGCIKHLQKQEVPSGVDLVDDEFILHVEGTASTLRVVRHIGVTSWPGKLTLTNYALYFEASGVISYEDAIKFDLSKGCGQNVKRAATGPWGAPLYNKAIIYESSDLKESIVLEFPEMASSTRRDHWLALVKEVMLLHQFLFKFKVESPVQVWEMHARTILGIIRLHAAREMLRITPPNPKTFLIFTLFEELPKGDFVLDTLVESLKNVNSGHPCSASSILRNLNVTQACGLCTDTKEITEESEVLSGQAENISSLESVIDQIRDEAREVNMAKATTEGLKEDGVSDSYAVLKDLLKSFSSAFIPWLQEVLTWEKPGTTVMVVGVTLLIVYMEWICQTMATLLLWTVGKMIWARHARVGEKYTKLVVCIDSDQTTLESLVSAQHGLNTLNEIMQLANISMLKIWSILISKAPKFYVSSSQILGFGGSTRIW
ncbi:uncharacterized protein LOC141689246 isoform X2 [Apium graveolens]|uniref:uncharacterized protein LOC141689246 isoform X2 n=1 Tax=Apium graveolens TaxID=4045 RepID=UPI003D7B7CD9